MDSKALFVGIEAEPGKEGEVAEFLRGASGSVEEKPDTRGWYALRFALAEFAIFDTFPDNAGRLKHLLGQAGRSLIAKTMALLDDAPELHPADILAAKVPASGGRPTCCLHVPLKARDGLEEGVASFLVGAQPMVEAEPGTLSWYALRMGDDFAIVDFFPDEAARDAHLSGQVAKALTARADELFAVTPVIRRGEVLASKTYG